MQQVRCAVCGRVCDTAIFTSTSAIETHDSQGGHGGAKGWLCMECYYAISADYTD